MGRKSPGFGHVGKQKCVGKTWGVGDENRKTNNVAVVEET